MTAQKWVSRAGGLITITILTRLLNPEDFGLVAIAWTIVTLTYVLSDMGLATYIIQADNVDRNNLSTAFWVSLIVGISLGGIIFALAPFLADALSTPAATPILQAMAGLILVIAASSVPLALLRRRMAFRRLAAQEVTGALIAQVVAIAAALGGLGVWALVLQLMVGQVITSSLMWVSARWRPTLNFSGNDFSTMIRFGMQVVGNGLVGVFRGWAETGIIVAGLGIRELGYFNIAQRLVQTASDLSGSALFPVSTVAFARSNSSLDRLRAAHAKATSVSQAVVTPLMIYIAVSASLLVPFLFGPEWTPSAQVAIPLAIAATLAFGVNVDHGLHNGVGRPGRWLGFALSIFGVSATLMLIAVPHGMLAVALAFTGTAIVEMIGRWFMVARLLDQTVWRTALPFLGVLPAATISAAAGVGVMALLSGTNTVVTLTVTGLVVLGVHAALIRVVTPHVWEDLLSLLPKWRGAGATPAPEGGGRSG
ncbi:MAG: lipopolysaccharide biosynthesis protein [Propionibacteriaceae bacterium]|nr:lipopolysaccharide biosynthesis protein [Propionibacteriaceae bacterium]